ncbi:MAG: hypothetical protein HY650_04820 [Acidobacteria bacterium]|nr:hypothetical protein [Acidobacteriota bacterium]
MEHKSDKMSHREQLRREIENLAEDQVLEVLEYVSIMKTLREQEQDPLSFKDEIRILLAEPRPEKPPPGSPRHSSGPSSVPGPKR